MSDFKEFVHQVYDEDQQGNPKDYWFLVTCDCSGVWVTVYDHPVEAKPGAGISNWDAIGQSGTEVYDNKLQVHDYEHYHLFHGNGPTRTIVLEDDLAHWTQYPEEKGDK